MIRSPKLFEMYTMAIKILNGDGSDWSIDRIIKLEISTAEYVPLEGSTYVPLPKKIQRRKAIINVQNEDLKCFVFSTLAAIHPVKDNPQRVTHYIPYENDLDLRGIDFPVPLSQVQKFKGQKQYICYFSDMKMMKYFRCKSLTKETCRVM